MAGETSDGEKDKHFREADVKLHMHLSPAHLGNVRAGVLEQLNQSILRCAGTCTRPPAPCAKCGGSAQVRR